MENKPEKAYCCGNSVQREATLLSKFDFVVSTVIFIVLTTLTSILVSSPVSKSEVAEKKPDNVNGTDLSSFLTLSAEAQGGIITYVMFVFLLGMALAVLLFVGARKRNLTLLLSWLMTSSVLFIIEVITMVIWIVYSTEQMYWTCLLVLAMLYKWYCLWIVKVLMREIRTVAEGYVNPLDSIEPDGISNGNVQELDKF